MNEEDGLPKVLVVDDDLMNINVFEALLSELRQTCDTALGGKPAIDLVEKRLALVHEGQAQMYNLVLLDYSMPGKDGPEVCLEIRKLCRDNGVS